MRVQCSHLPGACVRACVRACVCLSGVGWGWGVYAHLAGCPYLPPSLNPYPSLCPLSVSVCLSLCLSFSPSLSGQDRGGGGGVSKHDGRPTGRRGHSAMDK